MADNVPAGKDQTIRPQSAEAEDMLSAHLRRLCVDALYWQTAGDRVSRLCAKAVQVRDTPVPAERVAELEEARKGLTEKHLAMTLKERCDYFEAHFHPGAWREPAEIVVAAILLIDRTAEIVDLFE